MQSCDLANHSSDQKQHSLPKAKNKNSFLKVVFLNFSAKHKRFLTQCVETRIPVDEFSSRCFQRLLQVLTSVQKVTQEERGSRKMCYPASVDSPNKEVKEGIEGVDATNKSL